MTLYADVLFAINFSMDFLSLFICSIILHKKAERKRIIMASLIGALYGVIDVVFSKSQLLSLLFCVLISILMCLISFFEKSIKRILITILVYWGVSASLGGVMSLLYSLLNRLFYDIIKSYSSVSIYNGSRFFIIASLTAVVSIIVSRIFTSKKDVKAIEIKIIYENCVYKIQALCDSGNLLVEPISQKPVILVAEKTRMGKVLASKEDKYKRYIPYKDVGGEGILKGAIPDKVYVGDNLVDAIVAPIKHNDFAGYDALVPRALI
jgi:stage II sporulation protein GA (sporulation sigma-E factor processing peptidase)